MKEKSRAKSLISEYFIFVIFIALVVVLTCLKPSFIQPANLVNILKQASIVVKAWALPPFIMTLGTMTAVRGLAP